MTIRCTYSDGSVQNKIGVPNTERGLETVSDEIRETVTSCDFAINIVKAELIDNDGKVVEELGCHWQFDLVRNTEPTDDED